MSKKTLFLTCSFLLILSVLGCVGNGETTTDGSINYLTDFEPVHADGDINVVIEIPAGTLEKWEVSKPSGNMALNQVDGKPRIIQYLGYPGNYGMIPQTLLPKALGGDGDPLDVLVLGAPVERGTIVKAKVIGVLQLLDGGEQDDKLIAVQQNSPLYRVDTLEQLQAEYKGIAEIIETWFSNYKGAGKLASKGFYNRDKAKEILDKSIEAFAKK